MTPDEEIFFKKSLCRKDFCASISCYLGGIGAAEGIRTPDPRITNAVLYRLSYRGVPTEWQLSNTRGLLTQGTLAAGRRCAGATLNRRGEGPTLPRIPMN